IGAIALFMTALETAQAHVPAPDPLTVDQYMDPDTSDASDIILGKVTALAGPFMEISVLERYKGDSKDTVWVGQAQKYPVGSLLLMPLKHAAAEQYWLASCRGCEFIDVTKSSTDPRLAEFREIREERQKLEKAVADNPQDASPLIALGKFEERWHEN